MGKYRGKIIKLLCVFIAGITMLTACGKEKEEHIASTSVDAAVFDFSNECVVGATENGYYFWESLNSNAIKNNLLIRRLMFLDKKTGQVVPLCNKANCTHDSEACNAYYPEIDVGNEGIDKRYLQYYAGSLYAVGLDSDDYVTLYRIKADGSEWEASTRLYKTDYASSGRWSTPDVLIHNGYVYFVDTRQQKQKLERVRLGGGNAELICGYENDDAESIMIYRLKESGEYLYFQAETFFDSNYNDYEGGLYRYDDESGQYSLVKDQLVGPYSVLNETVYFGNLDGLCCYSIPQDSVEILADQPMDIPYITLTEDYVVTYDYMGDKTLTICDYNGGEITTVYNPEQVEYFGGNSDLLFGTMSNGELEWCILDMGNIDEELKWIAM